MSGAYGYMENCDEGIVLRVVGNGNILGDATASGVIVIGHREADGKVHARYNSAHQRGTQVRRANYLEETQRQ